jgi:hypothetical protein
VHDDVALSGRLPCLSYLLKRCLYLTAKYPEEQDKLYRELIVVEGPLSAKLETLPVATSLTRR